MFSYIFVFLFFIYSGYPLLRDPRYNKGLSFNEKERDGHFLRGLLPPVVISQDLQVDIILTPNCLIKASCYFLSLHDFSKLFVPFC